VSPHIIFVTVCAQNVRLQYERKHVDASPLAYVTAHSITVWLRAAHSLLMRLFSSSTSEIDYDRLAHD